MKKTHLVLTAGILAAGHTAQSQDSARVSELNTYTVTATKFAKKLSETGKVVTIIGNRQIEQNLGRSVADVLNESTGIVIGGVYSNPGKNREVYFRGATSQYTTILMDGIPVADATGLTGNAIDLRFLPIDQVERIEILRGTQTTLYGADAIAGVINIIMKKGGEKPVNVFGDLMFGSNRTMKGSLGLRGKQDNIDYNIAFTHFTTDGISEAAKPDTAKDIFDRDGYRQNGLNATVGIQATENLRIQPFLFYSDYKSRFDGGSFADSRINKNESDFLHSGVRAQYAIGTKGKVYGNFAYQRVNRFDETGWDTTHLDGRSYFGEAYGHYDLTDWLQALAGVEYRQAEMVNGDEQDRTWDVHSQNTVSPYMSLFLKNLHGFNLELGGRYTVHNKYGNKFTYTINPSYVFSDKFKVFATVASGFKAPTLTSLYSQYGNPELKPEHAESYEAGFQTYLLQNKLDLRVVGFKRNIKDQISYLNYKYINFNQQKDKGVEVEVGLKPVDRLQVKLSYAYVDGNVTTQNAAGKDTTYSNLVRRPNHTGQIEISFQATKGLFVGTSVRHTGTRGDLYYAPNAWTAENIQLEAYTMWNAYAEYNFGKAKVFLHANNITNNKKYWEIYGYATLGFNMQSGVSFSF